MDIGPSVSNETAFLSGPLPFRPKPADACLEAATHAFTVALQTGLLERDPLPPGTGSLQANLAEQTAVPLKRAVDAARYHIKVPGTTLYLPDITSGGSLSDAIPDSLAETLRSLIKRLFRRAQKAHGNKNSRTINYWRQRTLRIFDRPVSGTDALSMVKQLAADLETHSVKSKQRPLSEAWRRVFMMGVDFALRILPRFTAAVIATHESNLQGTNVAAAALSIHPEAKSKRVARKRKRRSKALAASTAKTVEARSAASYPSAFNNAIIGPSAVNAATIQTAKRRKKIAVGKQAKGADKHAASDAAAAVP